MKRTKSIDKNEERYSELTRDPGHELNEKEKIEVWNLVRAACWSLATTITRNKNYIQNRELFEDRVDEATMQCMEQILVKKNPRFTTEKRGSLITAVYWPTFVAFFGKKAIAEDENYRNKLELLDNEDYEEKTTEECIYLQNVTAEEFEQKTGDVYEKIGEGHYRNKQSKTEVFLR